MKTWEVIKTLSENHNLKFEGVAQNGLPKILSIDKDGFFKCFQGNYHVLMLPDEDWKLIEQPVTFEEVLKSDSECRVEHDLICDDEWYECYHTMYKLANESDEEGLREIIRDGKWYLKEEI